MCSVMSKKVLMVVMKTICKQIREKRAMLMWKVIAKALTGKRNTEGPISRGVIGSDCA